MTATLQQPGTDRAAENLLAVEDLRMYFPLRGGLLQRRKNWVRAVDGIAFTMRKGETLGLVGESGCGKSTTGRAILQLYKPTSGRVEFEGRDLTAMRGGELRLARRNFQMIFQDPYGSLNPKKRVGASIGEPLAIHKLASGRQARQRVSELLEMVGLSPDFADRFPHEFSGGQRQRIGIARALAAEPTFLVCDEPISALDVSIQAQVVNLLEDLQSELGLTYLFIAHDLSVVRHISDRVAVMYLGKIVELAERDDLYEFPLHPYTIALQSAVPVPDPVVERRRRRIILSGDVPSPVNPPTGCRFHTRCWLRERLGRPDSCVTTDPELLPARPNQFVACHFASELVEPSRRDELITQVASELSAVPVATNGGRTGPEDPRPVDKQPQPSIT